MGSWYEEMAVAMKKRQTAMNGLKRWQTKVAEAEAEIQRLSNAQTLNIATGEPQATPALFVNGAATE